MRTIINLIPATLSVLLVACNLPGLVTPPPSNTPVSIDRDQDMQNDSTTQLASTSEPTKTSQPAATPTSAVLSQDSATATLTPGETYHQITPEEGLPAAEVFDLWVGLDGRLWVATDAGIYVEADGEWEPLYDGQVERILGADGMGRVWAILEGEKAIASYESGGVWRVYGPEQGWNPPPPPDYLSPGYGDGLVTDQHGRVWLATGRDDLRRFNPDSNTWQIFSAIDLGHDPLEEDGYQGHFLTDVALIDGQTVWIGDCIGIGEVLSGQGISQFADDSWLAVPDTDGECVLDIEIDGSGLIWAGGFDALLQFNPGTSTWVRFHLPSWERRQLVTNITLDRDGRPWVEVMRYGGASPLGSIARYHMEDGNWVKDFEDWFSSLAFGNDGTAWLCSEGSVFKLNDGQAEEIGHVPVTSCQIVVDGTGRIWIAGRNSLWRLEP